MNAYSSIAKRVIPDLPSMNDRSVDDLHPKRRIENPTGR